MSGPPHRATVRDRVTEIFRAGMPQVEGRVFRARTWSLQEGDFPALLVYGWQEELKRLGGTSAQSRFQASWILGVEVRVRDRSRDAEEVEAELEELTGLARDLVLTNAGLVIGPARVIERVEGVKTTLGIDTRSSELALGRGLLAFEFIWPETFNVEQPDSGCCVGPDVALRPVLAPSAP
ncbi:hypothetical protein [Roseomonas indoligenes]|uniref:Uncharacterized protein n=1 Tax=Roseomonas indoligenes TaxID=2820811 RepID=A0A940N072_9PROT|nr:hypothetical protein [Pararoseomonas indoligenes]MBP0492875.1 hypothetical protein [Pararoseomonas indoligenes]